VICGSYHIFSTAAVVVNCGAGDTSELCIYCLLVL